MKGSEILAHVDHTLLSPTAGWADICRVADEAIACGCASLCIPATYVARLQETYGDRLNICTVIGFPLGYDSLEAKLAAADAAVKDGAGEVDMVVNLCDVKNGSFDKIGREIFAIKRAIGKHILKVIVETCYLTNEEKIKLCEIVTRCKADYIKTSTGFGTAGATIEDIRLFKANIGPNVKMKAAGGINTIEDLNAFIDEGCERIGTSRAVGLLKDQL